MDASVIIQGTEECEGVPAERSRRGALLDGSNQGRAGLVHVENGKVTIVNKWDKAEWVQA